MGADSVFDGCWGGTAGVEGWGRGQHNARIGLCDRVSGCW